MDLRLPHVRVTSTLLPSRLGKITVASAISTRLRLRLSQCLISSFWTPSLDLRVAFFLRLAKHSHHAHPAPYRAISWDLSSHPRIQPHLGHLQAGMVGYVASVSSIASIALLVHSRDFRGVGGVYSVTGCWGRFERWDTGSRCWQLDNNDDEGVTFTCSPALLMTSRSHRLDEGVYYPNHK